MTRLVIVGGSDAGISAALRARELDPDVQPLLVVADGYPNFSICGIPYHVSGEVPDWRDLAHRTETDLRAAGLDLRLDTHAEHIDPQARTLTVTTPDGTVDELGYDQLIIGTGAVPVRPPIAGLDRLGPAGAAGHLRGQVSGGVPPGQPAERGVGEGDHRVEVAAGDRAEHQDDRK